jgi:hypothetical protein
LYLKSLEANQSVVDVVFITDIPTETLDIPTNAKFIHLALAELKKLANKKLGFDVRMENGYKACDFKPAYGKIFEDFIEGYDFWGFGDIDLIYGDLSSLINDELLNKYDILQCREKWISGSFCLIRNSEKCRSLFLESTDYKRVFTDDYHFSFTEASHQWKPIRQLSIFEIDFPYENFSLITRRAEQRGELRIFRKNLVKETIHSGGYVSYIDGKISDELNREYLMYHFVTEKRQWFFSYPSWNSLPSRFFITKYGFFTNDEVNSRLSYNLILLKILLVKAPNLLVKLFGKLKRRFIG